MIDFGLKPCPLCGGKARVDQLTEGRAIFDAHISCERCGLRLEWSTTFAVFGADCKTVIQLGPNPFEAWNRRTKS